MKVLITGGAGFIGSNLAERLLARGDEVRGIDSYNDFYDPAVKRANAAAVCVAYPQYRVYENDIRDGEAVLRIFEEFRPDAVVHLAAYAGVRPSIENPALYYDVNLMGSVRLLDAMVKTGCRRMAFASSSSVYGNNKKVPFSEADAVDHPISPYAATKKAGELLMHTYHALHGLSVACLRFFTVYGPRQRPDLAISKFARLMRAGQPIPVFGDGSTSRDYTYIDDITDGIARALDYTAGEPKYDIFNLGGSSPVSLSEMIQTLEKVLEIPAQIQRLPMQPGDVERTFADVRHSGEVLGYRAATSFEQGIRKYARWLEESAK